ncbi:MAG: GNAT family N-acetyltransferase [Reichenbachiella sp.]|uniref:GNAT family N-acetyltransferase n=1 Tax=Reichenbachiella sp. TaxID=2184521 RepID=UPI0029672788|nr:GNAT family N-acetyltransferase [Reichenbachiella sp.]MDW3209083.1 GNAT family N-acetyltransferase [Reichenbachiella sp.]
MDIKKLFSQDVNDFSKLIQVFENVFEWGNFNFPTQAHLRKLLNNSNFFVFVAKDGDELIGGLTAHVLDRYDNENPSVYVYDLAILTNYQRKGIGKKLMSTLNEYCEKNGFNEVFVQAETDDFQAVNFYRTTPISEELQATHFTYSFNKKKDV